MTKPKRTDKAALKAAQHRDAYQQLYDLMDNSGRTASGESVGPFAALKLSVYYACIRNISEDLGKLPLILYRRTGKDGKGKERATDHPLYRLLHDSPNPEMTAFTFREMLTAHALAWHGGFAEIERNGAGLPTALWPLHPGDVKVERVGTQIKYVYKVGGKTTALSSENVLHIHGLSDDGINGMAISTVGRETIGSALAVAKHSAKFFSNGATLGGVLSHPGHLTPKALQNLRASFAARHSGADNAYKLLVTEEGMNYTSMAIDPEKARMIEAQQYGVEDVCRLFRMPPHKVGHLLRATGWSTLEATNLDYLTDTLMPWQVRWEQELSRKLLPTPDLFAEHLVDALLRVDTTTRFAAYASGITNGWLSRNEVRVKENMNPVDGLDEYLKPLNMGSATEPPAEPKPEPTPEPKPDDQPSPEDTDDAARTTQPD